MVNEVVKPPSIVDNVDGDDENIDVKDDEDYCFDPLCAICDDGGYIYPCDGKCMRSFHATVEDGEQSACESLGSTDVELEAMNDVFLCKNCEYKQHQCFACGKLGSSDESSDPEVFCCADEACWFFYHPYCVAKLLHPGDDAAAEEHQQKIAAGEKFACPAHRCDVCKELEMKKIKELQFAVCRRCPRAYHRKCLPREIPQERDADLELGVIQRAWEGLLPNRILIYCLNHEIDPDTLTPVRNHIKFPGPQRKKKNQLKKRGYASEDTTAGKIVSAEPLEGIDEVTSGSKQGDLSRRSSQTQEATYRNNLRKLEELAIDEREMSS